MLLVEDITNVKLVIHEYYKATCCRRGAFWGSESLVHIFYIFPIRFKYSDYCMQNLL